MHEPTEFIYRDFYDIPHSLLVRYKSYLFFLESSFEEEIDDYEEAYQVYRFADASLDTAGLWERLLQTKKPFFVGTINVKDVEFDPTKRKQIEGLILNQFL